MSGQFSREIIGQIKPITSDIVPYGIDMPKAGNGFIEVECVAF